MMKGIHSKLGFCDSHRFQFQIHLYLLLRRIIKWWTCSHVSNCLSHLIPTLLTCFRNIFRMSLQRDRGQRHIRLSYSQASVWLCSPSQGTKLLQKQWGLRGSNDLICLCELTYTLCVHPHSHEPFLPRACASGHEIIQEGITMSPEKWITGLSAWLI